ncbi:MAG: TrbC/VirB2 family protein [Rhodocyclaceae bacterium]|jgi:type IV secretory pathway VirB2 component (pilin)|nr:TrbC/VirB2 family protein [Rhodocyclaceae bacterium]MCA3018733.1 TrbC/VirB2 family protein [Rhodocyclaceae bacterium]MCA3025602.1 TrbC/VirB2 family protein [Rhodocyclaceae bacterium]MCA3028758.1 TrbC/VirB2 family protein [Rhodocyclaceae bacterium]MCA3032877.1 TrbC/VirB2 family protein [Rhodocyclaceae bacterium]
MRTRSTIRSMLTVVLLLVSVAAEASAPGTVPICRLTQYISGTIVLAIAAFGVAAFGIMHMTGIAREGAMESALKVIIGGSAAMFAIALIGYIFNAKVC